MLSFYAQPCRGVRAQLHGWPMYWPTVY